MQLRNIYLNAKNRFQNAGFNKPDIETTALITNFFNVGRAEIYTKTEDILDSNSLEYFEQAVSRRLNGEPSAYITGSKEFYSKRFLVNKSVLIPRPETETVVEEAIKIIPKKVPYKLLDLGTGSGCIGVTISLLCDNVDVIASDISKDSLKIAKKNSQFHKTQKISFIRSDNLNAIKNASLDMIVSNPPYISSKDYCLLDREVYDYEPRLALEGGIDGLDIIKKIVFYSKEVLKFNGWCLVEVGIGQSKIVEELFYNNGFKEISSVSDLSGIDRVVKAKWKK